MQANIITVIPVYNGARFLLRTLESVAAQTRRPDRLIVLDNCSTDATESIVRGFQGFPCEWIRNPTNLGLFGNMNRALEFAPQTRHLHLLCADDLIAPRFFETLVPPLESGDGFGLAFCLDERIDENGEHLSLSGRVTGAVEAVRREDYLRQKGEIANQALGGTIFKTNFQPAPCQFRRDMPILADVVFYAEWGRHCQKIVKVHEALTQYRWHGTNTSCELMPGLQPLVLDEWKTMELIAALQGGMSFGRRCKLRGLFGVRSGIKARRIRQLGNWKYSREIVAVGRRISGLPLWFAAQGVVHAREFIVYGLLRRRRQPQNVFG
ncbi:MAG: glycosyltransferase family A protein [Verrucomicrobiota bacterium]|nr:glycosyltransferase family 2 protein [Verrucomicrobiota bacterium]MCC6822874.1 glycosyltransferase family 2 protein [Limisphaerales bacterium]